MAAEMQRMREQLELLQAELLCNNARNGCLDDTNVISLISVVSIKVWQCLLICVRIWKDTLSYHIVVSYPRKRMEGSLYDLWAFLPCGIAPKGFGLLRQILSD
jgi:hypothetical protein